MPHDVVEHLPVHENIEDSVAPILVDQILAAINVLKRDGTTIFLVEQNAFAALSIADRGYVLETGSIVLEGSGRELLANERVQVAYLGV